MDSRADNDSTSDDFARDHLAGDDLTRGGQAVEVIRSEEQLAVGTRSHVVGRIRVAKRIVTEERTVAVTVRREELVVEQIDGDAHSTHHGDLLVDASTAWAGETAADRSATRTPVVELVLSEEEVEVVTRVVPRERVRVYVDVVTEQATVTENLAREVVDVEASDPAILPSNNPGISQV